MGKDLILSIHIFFKVLRNVDELDHFARVFAHFNVADDFDDKPFIFDIFAVQL